MPGRKYTAGASSYRYSINGQEKESELNENITTAQYWEYDSRIGRRWNVDPVKKHSFSPYFTFAGNPLIMVDPDGNDEYWQINKKTGAIKRTKANWVGDNIWIMDKDGVYKKLHEIKIEFTKASRQFDIGVASVLTYYANTASPAVSEVFGLSQDKESLAFYNPDDDGMYVSVKDGYINKEMTNYFTLKSVIKHEKNHKEDFANGVLSSFASHFKVYINQISDFGFSLMEENDNRGTISNALGYLFNGYETKSENPETLRKLTTDFDNAIKKLGFSYTVNYKKDKNGQYNDIESFNITKTQTIDGKTTTSTSTIPYEKKTDSH